MSSRGKIGTGIIVGLLITLTVLISSKLLSLFFYDNNSDNSLYYVQILNYSIPAIKVGSFNSEDLAEKNKMLKERFWGTLNIDINSPITFLGKEMAFLKIEQLRVNDYLNNGISVTPYNLKDSNVLKQNADSSLKGTLNPEKPEVLIYHSHTTESYAPHANNSSDENYNVCAVGDALKSELEKNYGISVIHDKTVHDEMGDINAYGKSRETVEKYLKQYGSFKLIIDMHRDSSSNKKNDIAVINGETVAKCMFVLCKQCPYADKEWAIANKMIAISNSLFPGFLKNDIFTYNKGVLYYNQDLSANSVLIEVGTNLNNVNEAKGSSKYLARIIAQCINGK